MFLRRYSHLAAFAVVVGSAALLGVSCGDGDSWNPPSAPVNPAPPSATSPPSSGGSGASSCPLGEGTTATYCDRTFSELQDYVERAMDRLVEERPALFDLTTEKGLETHQYLVLQKEEYLDGLVDELRKMGLCAGRSNTDYEIIQVKNQNEFSEDYDVYTADGFMRRGSGAYRMTCTPAAFPVARDPNAPPQGSGCGVPYPPPISRIKVYFHLKGQEYDTLDATPLVGHDVVYCASIGFTDGRSLCPVRPEGHPEREACETWAVGRAEDTNRPGPTWTNGDGAYCTGGDSSCRNAENQYQLWVSKSGTYTACAANKACGSTDVRR
jgi:hypothetical protein